MTADEFDAAVKQAFPYACRVTQDKGPFEGGALYDSVTERPEGLVVRFWVSPDKDFRILVETVEQRAEQDWLLHTPDDTWELRRLPSESQAKAFAEGIRSGEY